MTYCRCINPAPDVKLLDMVLSHDHSILYLRKQDLTEGLDQIKGTLHNLFPQSQTDG